MIVRPTFVYGTLMAEEVIQGLIGRVPRMISPAFLPGCSRWTVGKSVRHCTEVWVLY